MILLVAAFFFIWQVPHFLALAWMYRDDYALGGYRMLPIVDESGRLTAMTIPLTGDGQAPVVPASLIAEMSNEGVSAALGEVLASLGDTAGAAEAFARARAEGESCRRDRMIDGTARRRG